MAAPIYIEELGLDGKFLAVLRYHEIKRVADVVTRVREGTLGALSNIGDNRLKNMIAKLKELSLLDSSFVYKKSDRLVKVRKVTTDYQRISGNDMMPFMWQGRQCEIEVEGWSTLWFHRQVAAMVLIAMYELILEDVPITKDNTHERYKEVGLRFDHTETVSGTTVIRMWPVLEQFHIDGEHNPFIMAVGDKSYTRKKKDASNVMGRGGDAFRWRPIMVSPRIPFGMTLCGKREFEIASRIVSNNLVLELIYSAREIRNDNSITTPNGVTGSEVSQ